MDHIVAEEQFGCHNQRIPNGYREIFRREDLQYTSGKKGSSKVFIHNWCGMQLGFAVIAYPREETRFVYFNLYIY